MGQSAVVPRMATAERSAPSLVIRGRKPAASSTGAGPLTMATNTYSASSTNIMYVITFSALA